jgi:hypothetical protein
MPNRQKKKKKVSPIWGGGVDGCVSVSLLCADSFSITYEKACVLFNLGALLNQLGTLQNRNTSDGLKAACGYFQVRMKKKGMERCPYLFNSLLAHFVSSPLLVHLPT